MDYKEYMVNPEDLEFERAMADQQEALRMINYHDKVARVFAVVMCGILGVVATVVLFLNFGIIAAGAALAFTVLLVAGVLFYLSRVFDEYHDFEIVPVEVVSTEYKAGELRVCDLWSEEQQKCVRYKLVRANNRLHKGAKGFYVRAISDKRKDYIMVTDHEYKIMKMNADNRKR